jgi:hypothetical protein
MFWSFSYVVLRRVLQLVRCASSSDRPASDPPAGADGSSPSEGFARERPARLRT